jgi:hypothetical protein
MFILGLLGVAVVGGLGWYFAKKRREAFAAFARSHGMTYSHHDPYGTINLPFRLFTKGDGRKVENVVAGDWRGNPVRAFDYWYYDESTDSDGNRTKTYYRFTCALLDIEAAFPPLAITRENVFTRMADGLGFRDIEFESPDFNKGYQVKAKDRHFAYAFIDGRMMKWLLGLPRKWEFEIVGAGILAYEKKRMKPEEFPPLIEMALAFRQQVPRAALSLYGQDVSSSREERA